MNPSRLAIISVLGAATLTAGAELAQGKAPGARIIIGATVAAVVLSAAAGPLPALVRALSIIIIITAVLGPGYSLAKPLTQLVK